MRLSSLLSILPIALGVAAYGQTKTAGSAHTSATCSPATSGDNNTFYFTYCGNDPAQQRKIVQLLNLLITHTNAMDAQLRLDQMLQIAAQPSQVQSNSGGVNVFQGTSGASSPIINSPITVGEFPKSIPQGKQDELRRLLGSAPLKAAIAVFADQYSGGAPMPQDFYDVLKASGWPVLNAGVGNYMQFTLPGGLKSTVEVAVGGKAPDGPITDQVSSLDPTRYICAALQALDLTCSVRYISDQPPGLIKIQFEGGYRTSH